MVVGAGASHKLGIDRPIPLMRDWAAALIERLNDDEPELAKAIGLAEGL